MAIGERIRFIRNLRGMTQKYLGTLVGFSEKTADIRMAQYEAGTRTPKEDLTNALASALDVSPLALTVPDIDSYLGLRIGTVRSSSVLIPRKEGTQPTFPSD